MRSPFDWMTPLQTRPGQAHALTRSCQHDAVSRTPGLRYGPAAGQPSAPDGRGDGDDGGAVRRRPATPHEPSSSGPSQCCLGQLSIGWSNDAIDAGRDGLSGRTDKPVARGELATRLVMRSALIALQRRAWPSRCCSAGALGWSTCSASVADGPTTRRLKSTIWSPAPFAIAFGGLPAVATLALPEHPWPPIWSMLAGALIGVAAHFANVLPDIDDDRRSGVRGLPQRMGPQATAFVAMASALAACCIVTVADRLRCLAPRRLSAPRSRSRESASRCSDAPGARRSFLATIVIAAIGVVAAGDQPVAFRPARSGIRRDTRQRCGLD